ncbi:hypothetical protein FE840_010205 [Peteryoungia desertarenae]|uniref:Holin n=1 Tax=Peteryoungia desertarenae TaxID=1813451 RepID=A0ABX6QMM3_9HYPH|nr:hypothetical protein [Peteryoungia desertarenae]QLF69878.1 hypothetical protein FE840_010205 [Peteryoungia desertarenae]
MFDTKPWYQSKTVWGALIAIAAPLADMAGLTVDEAMKGELADHLVSIAGAFGGMIALYGRVVATRPIR